MQPEFDKLSDEQKAVAKKHGEECITQVELGEEDVKKLKAKDFSNASQNLKCFANCFFEKVGTMKDGAVVEDVALEKLTLVVGADKAKSVLDKCKDLKGAEQCETAYKIQQCFEEHRAELKA